MYSGSTRSKVPLTGSQLKIHELPRIFVKFDVNLGKPEETPAVFVFAKPSTLYGYSIDAKSFVLPRLHEGPSTPGESEYCRRAFRKNEPSYRSSSIPLPLITAIDN